MRSSVIGSSAVAPGSRTIMSLFITTLFFSVFITIVLIPILTKQAVRFNVVDIPDQRKVHKRPIPRIGGAAMALGVFVTVLAFLPKDNFVTAFLLGAGIIVLFGLADDLTGLGYKSKFAGQAAAALIIIFYGKVRILALGNLFPDSLFLSEWAPVLLTFIIIVGVTNAINLSDGLDGLAAGICLMSFCCIAYLAYKAGISTILFLSVSMVGAVFGFLRFNTYPATIFMGDGGSQLLGFSGIVLAIKLTQEGQALSPVLPLFLFGLPILDTLTVMSQRILEGKSPFIADRNHLHHKLMRLGLSHTEAVFAIYMVQALLIIFALFFRSSSDWLLLLGFVLFCALIIIGFSAAEIYSYRFRRYDFIDEGLKRRLIRLKDQGLLIRYCFLLVKLGLPALLMVTVFLPGSIPLNLAYPAGISVILLASFLAFRQRAAGMIVRLMVYLFVPYLIYLSETNIVTWMTHQYVLAYNFSFLLLAFLGIMTLKFTRRQNGFKFNTMDFLVFVILFVVLILPDKQVKSHHLGMLASKTIILFFSFEILAGELRGKWRDTGFAMLLICSMIALRGLCLF